MKFVVLGGGAQGSAAAFELLGREQVSQVVLVDSATRGLPAFLEPYLGGKLVIERVDAEDEASISGVLEGASAVCCALPYYFNLPMARVAIRAGAHFCDLGGNTEIVESQRGLDATAEALGVSVIPDCGLAPGMVNIIAQAGIDALDVADSVQIRVGGLPQNPQPPLNYQIVYSMEGVLDYYTTDALILFDGAPAKVDALSGLETVSFPSPLGDLEAFYTGGGISTLPLRHQGKVRSMGYKTLRYPGHADLMLAMRDLGLLSLDPVQVKGQEVVPRDVFISTVSPELRSPEARDLVAMSVEVAGTLDGAPRTFRWDMVDYYDEENAITAMMRCTGYSLAITALMQADGRVTEHGVRTPDEAVPAEGYLAELALRGINVERSER
jgi:lysine 6-dehydrogenase